MVRWLSFTKEPRVQADTKAESFHQVGTQMWLTEENTNGHSETLTAFLTKDTKKDTKRH